MKRSVKSFVFDFLSVVLALSLALVFVIVLIEAYEAWILPLFPLDKVKTIHHYIFPPAIILLSALVYAIYRAKNKKHF